MTSICVFSKGHKLNQLDNETYHPNKGHIVYNNETRSIQFYCRYKFIIINNHTVDGRNPKQPPGMHKALQILPRSLTWTLKISPWKRRFRTWKPSFSGSMLNFGGVIISSTSSCDTLACWISPHRRRFTRSGMAFQTTGLWRRATSSTWTWRWDVETAVGGGYRGVGMRGDRRCSNGSRWWVLVGKFSKTVSVTWERTFPKLQGFGPISECFFKNRSFLMVFMAIQAVCCFGFKGTGGGGWDGWLIQGCKNRQNKKKFWRRGSEKQKIWRWTYSKRWTLR